MLFYFINYIKDMEYNKEICRIQIYREIDQNGLGVTPPPVPSQSKKILTHTEFYIPIPYAVLSIPLWGVDTTEEPFPSSPCI